MDLEVHVPTEDSKNGNFADIEFVEGKSRIRIHLGEGSFLITREDGSMVSISVKNGRLAVNQSPRS